MKNYTVKKSGNSNRFLTYLVAFKFFVIILASPGANYRYTPITIKLSNHSLGSLCHLLSQRKNKLWSFQKVHFIKQSYMLYTLPQSAKVIYILLLFLLKHTNIIYVIRKNQCRFFMFYKVYLLKHFEVGYPGK